MDKSKGIRSKCSFLKEIMNKISANWNFSSNGCKNKSIIVSNESKDLLVYFLHNNIIKHYIHHIYRLPQNLLTLIHTHIQGAEKRR